MLWNKLERNQVYQLIRQKGIDPAECQLEITQDKAGIAHNSGSVFLVERIPNDFPRARFTHEVTSIVEDGPTKTFKTTRPFTEVIDRIGVWASQIAAPDLWEEMQRNQELIGNIQHEDASNTPFTQDEQRQIAAQLQEITKRLKEQSKLTTKQIEQIEEWKKEATEASTRMGRKDWIIYILGSITALIITVTVAAGIGEHIFTMMIHALGHLFTAGREPPQIIA